MKEVIVKLVTDEIVKISAVKEIYTAEHTISIINHLGEEWLFSVKNISYVKATPLDYKENEND